MSNKLGARKKQLQGKMRDGWNYLYSEAIEGDFYGILKEEGLNTARNIDGSYYDAEAQKLWLAYLATQAKNND